MARIKHYGWLFVLFLFLASCGTFSRIEPEKMEEKMVEKPTAMSETIMVEQTKDSGKMIEKASATPEAMMGEKKTPDPMKDQGGMMDTPAWFKADLVDVQSGKIFRVSDFRGKVVMVEMFAIWCPTCLRQQKEIKALYEGLGMPEDLILINLDIDPNEDEAGVKAYAEKNGFFWRYAVAPVDVAREIGNLYGSQFLNPPSAPVLLIDRDGKVILLDFGVKSVDSLKEKIEPLLKGGV